MIIDIDHQPGSLHQIITHDGWQTSVDKVEGVANLNATKGNIQRNGTEQSGGRWSKSPYLMNGIWQLDWRLEVSS